MLRRVATTSGRATAVWQRGVVGWAVKVPEMSTPGGIFSTKYTITKPYNEATTWDDFLITLPERDQLAKFSKEVPLFIRYLKLVTDKEGRKDQFAGFVAKCKDGLTVENDVYLSVDELLSVMWKNGYTEQERNAIQFTFPSDYKFHVPELASLFELTDEDCYKFCMRTRMEKSHIGELDWEKVKPRGFIRDHWLLYAGGFYLFKNFPFFNYVFFCKFWGFGLWFGTCWMLFGRYGNRLYRRVEYMNQQKTAQEVMDGEDKIVANMKRFADDGECLDQLKGFKGEVQGQLSEYRAALLTTMKSDMTERVKAQLQSIARFEQQMSAQLQETIVTESSSAFKAQFASDTKLQDAIIDGACKAITDGKMPASDPLKEYFTKAFDEVAKANLATVKGKADGTIVERVAAVQQAKEEVFKASFMVSAAEAAEVKKLGEKAVSGASFDLAKLDEASLKRLESLYTSINNRVGYKLPTEKEIMSEIKKTGDSSSDEFVDYANHQVSLALAKFQAERLGAFVRALS
jgi:restriction endonuclease Mrr